MGGWAGEQLFNILHCVEVKTNIGQGYLLRFNADARSVSLVSIKAVRAITERDDCRRGADERIGA